MKSETSLNPPTCALPFEMFRTFSPIVMKDPTRSGSVSEINEDEKEWRLAIKLPEIVDVAQLSTEFRSGVLMVTLRKRESTLGVR